MTGLRVFLSRLARQIWFRAACFTLGAVALALVAGILGPVLPSWLQVDLGQNSVGSILQILATSMLAVTTFSLTAMVSAYSSASSVGTPRATQLLMSDTSSQNALSTFLGSFVFSVVGIVALSTNYYSPQGRTVLFFGTLVVIAIIVVTLLSWIGRLARFGRMSDIIDRVEAAADRSVQAFADDPHWGGAPAVPVPAGAVAVTPEAAGFVTNIDLGVLGRLAERRSLVIHIRRYPGSAAHLGEPLARVQGDPSDDDLATVRGAFRVEAHRTYEQDPRLGVIALAEIASRALSPAVNDPGTAIEVLGALERLLLLPLDAAPPGQPRHPRLHVAAPSFEDLVEDGFRPIARDGASHVEVGIRIQKTLTALGRVADDERAAVLRDASRAAERRSVAALSDPGDVQSIRAAAASFGSGPLA